MAYHPYRKNIGLIFIILLTIQNLFSQNNHAEIITKQTVKSEDLTSIVVKVRNEDQSINTSISGSFQIMASPAVLDNDVIKIIRGVGSVTTMVYAPGDFNLSINGFSGEKTISVNNSIPVIQIEGQISINTSWGPDSIIHINNDLTINEGTVLTINAGANIVFGEKINLFVNGRLNIVGTPGKPVFFQPSNPVEPWGGVSFANPNDSSSVENCFFIYGGDNEEFIFGHSNSQPVLLIENSSLSLINTYILDNPGKAIGGSISHVKLGDCVISRCDTGGEYASCLVDFSGSYFINMPNDDGIPIDDDNDASYFSGLYPNTTQQSEINNCVFVNGKDDGIDHNGANLNIKDCWIEGFDHEGIAASNANNASVYNTLVKDCEQGIEAGYGEPNVIIDHCVLVNNDVGLRFGDSYNWGCEGHIGITNSIMYGNDDNIWNFDILTQGPVEDAIDVSYSMTNDIEYDNYPNCIVGTPVFDENYFLITGSPGIGLATDGSNLGLVDPNLGVNDNLFPNNENLWVSPNPFKGSTMINFILYNSADVLLQVFDNLGNLIFRQDIASLQAGQHSIPFNCRLVNRGLYLFVLSTNNQIVTIKVISH